MSSADVQSYEGLDPIESEMRRRIYWVSHPNVLGDETDDSAAVPGGQEYCLLGMVIL
jgi:hypothetical protein